MSYLPITLGIARPDKAKGKSRGNKGGAGSSGSASSSAEKLSNEDKQKIFNRDNNTCRFCGFVSKKYQDVLFIDSDLKNRDTKNMVTACIFCHQCFHLDDVARMRSGVLLWLPEIDQAELHHMARAIYVARISQGPIAEAARNSLDILMNRREEVKNRLGTDNVYILSTVLRDYLGPTHYNMRAKKLDGIRLFPLDRRIIKEADLEFNQFPQILAYWRSKDGPFGGKTPPQWTNIYQEIMKAA